jgi:hypothetical protein
MGTSDKEQMGEDVRYHARLAMGAKLDGTSLKAKGTSTPVKNTGKQSGGLASLKKQK